MTQLGIKIPNNRINIPNNTNRYIIQHSFSLVGIIIQVGKFNEWYFEDATDQEQVYI